ncbi:MAG: O-antigen ligase family protein [Alphaproteobacteria bacterium]|nr:O-antigen ligase family protein [Alphaproteobacteria bacterium]
MNPAPPASAHSAPAPAWRGPEAIALLPALLAGPVAYNAPMGLAPLMLVAALLALAAGWRAQGRAGMARAGFAPVLGAALPLLPLAALGVASALWSITPGPSLDRGLRLAAELAALVLLLAAAPAAFARLGPELRRAAALGLVAAALLALADLALGGPITASLRGRPPNWAAASYSRGAAAHAVAAWPLAALLWAERRRVLGALLLVCAIATAYTTRHMGSQLALAVGAIACGVVLLAPALRWALLAAQLAFLLALPLALPQPLGPMLCAQIDSKASIVHRVFIWNFAEAKRAERPLLGWGLEASRAIPGGEAPADFLSPCGRAVPRAADGTPLLPQTLPLHPHNAVLQVWLELGAAGAAALAWLLGAASIAAFGASARGSASVGARAAFSAGAFTVAVVSFGAWQSWWIGALALMAAALRQAGAPGERAQPKSLA